MEVRERMEDSGDGERVGVVRRPRVCGWKRVGVERGEENNRDESFVEGVSWGIWVLDLGVSWVFDCFAGWMMMLVLVLACYLLTWSSGE
jgi:hypothetical protein